MICMEARNAKGDKGTKNMDVKIRVQKGLVALNYWVTFTKQFDRVHYNYNSDLTTDLR